MYKRMLTMVAVLSFSQVAVADKAEIFKCIDSKSLTVQEECVANTFAEDSFNDNFYSQIAEKAYEPSNDAFASITYYPKLNLIEVKSMETKSKTTLIASR
ncbi:hypothetical protein [Colwellia sp. UCD-KL20]|uniref:hypothetical protein n=1 Tax=Colwellia sp. UCD-KL20 TaxID=1917165 RepID=UPI00097142A6|nr:hypothetical protein [Colwellia sp. UCD-KL20]